MSNFFFKASFISSNEALYVSYSMTIPSLCCYTSCFGIIIATVIETVLKMPKEHSSSSKHKKKHKKEKSHKKEKKLKKRKKEKSKSRNYSSSSSESSDSVMERVESRGNTKREEWNFLNAVLDESNVTKKEKQTENVTKSILDQPGQSDRELNPYWKNGGCGLPPDKRTATNSTVPSSSYSSYSKDSSSGDKKNVRCNFLKPGEDLSFKRNENSYQRNWRKKDFNSDVSKDRGGGEEKKKEENKVKNKEEVSKVLTNDELNSLAAKLMKAEIMGNKTLIEKLRAELDAAKKLKDQAPTSSNQQTQGKVKEIVVMTDDSKRNLKKSYSGDQSHSSSKRQKIDTHSSKERVRYFPDDDKYSLKNLFEKEKFGKQDDDLLSSKLVGKNSEDFDDAYLEAAASHKLQEKIEKRQEKKSIQEALVKHKTLEGCHWCLDNRNQTKHLIVSTGSKCYLCLPEEESLSPGHCIIVPVQHEISMIHLDEEVWDEIKSYQRALTKMFLERGQDVVFYESARSFKHYPHCYIQCVPLDKELTDSAPIYFQKAISECETEWSNNKKLIDFRHKDLRRTIPKGLPYFAVSFGNDGGFAHIIEDEVLFSRRFAEEVLGGMMDLDPKKWRKPQRENFSAQRRKALEFLKMWKKFEFNENSQNSSSDSDSSSSD